MYRSRYAMWLPIVLALSGCGGSPSPLKAGGPHQGVLIQLPESKGFAELVFEPLPKPGPRSSPTELALYFLGPDGATPMTSLPSDVAIDVMDPESRRKTPRPFKPSPRAGDPVGSARFATGPIDRDYSGFAIGGDLKANLGGPISIPF